MSKNNDFQQDDQLILQSLKQGNMEAIDNIYNLYRLDFIKSAKYKFSSCSEADIVDAWQDAVISFYEQIKNGRLVNLTCSIKSFVFLIGFRYIIKYHKHSQRQIATEEISDLDLAQSDTIELIEKDERKEELFRQIDLLPDQSRRMLLLRFVDGKSIPEIAKEMGYQSENSVSVTLSRSLKKLKEAMLSSQNQEK
ncbi:MAG: sigma-70 family RNA polymerase sigma factor [Saprospiraceae bacterium]|nr:sigma-70 family RNA polymerase sigma factor [Saprospiraceae bacterium]